VSIDARLAELGITLPDAAKPAGSYLPALRSGNHVWTSGQLPYVNGVLPATGKVGHGPGLIHPEAAAGYARQAAINALAAIKALAGSLDDVARVVKVVGYIASDPGFTGHAAVMNGASNLLGEVFGEAGQHARTSIGVAVLPLDAPVEVDMVVELKG
jgi:enamine deaminase RidA (YjgF/YER057c/UK114 family)